MVDIFTITKTLMFIITNFLFNKKTVNSSRQFLHLINYRSNNNFNLYELLFTNYSLK